MSRPPESERRAGPAAGTLPPLIDPERRAAVLSSLMLARRERIGDLLADWSPDEHRQVAELLRRYASDVPEEAPAPERS